MFVFFFFFQAEDGIRDLTVTGVQTCALPILLQKIRSVYALGDADKFLVPDQGIFSFMEHCSKRIGDTYFRTPRTTITAFINMLAVLDQNPGAAWQSLLGGIEVAPDTGGVTDEQVEVDDGDEFASFKM